MKGYLPFDWWHAGLARAKSSSGVCITFPDGYFANPSGKFRRGTASACKAGALRKGFLHNLSRRPLITGRRLREFTKPAYPRLFQPDKCF